MSVALGIDYGTKRVGLAISDELGMIASPLETIHSTELTAWLTRNIPLRKIKTVVVGEPKKLDGSDTDSTQLINELCVHLRRTFPQVEIVRVDERFTSSIAMQSMIIGGASKKQRQNKGAIDAISAALILRSWLESPKR
ncbi:MAG TPA: Holliday junction resolvase RuvX [Flavobacteriales bacterium]|nr:Holliday junction resolvase RuvX [Flavobacteriales bacterium]HRJ38748.1 Holliday junction resolvase RuvX [Flavobacteriales bacterium]